VLNIFRRLDSVGLLDRFMMDSGRMVNSMARVSLLMLMDLRDKESG
jgi:hypothetical protein